jgi:hypothetical protein
MTDTSCLRSIEDDGSILGAIASLFRSIGIPVRTVDAIEAFMLRSVAAPTQEPLKISSGVFSKRPHTVRRAASRTRRRPLPRRRAS